MGKNIRKRRMDLGLEQKDVAKIIGVTESSIWNWEHRMNPHKKYMKKIDGFLGYLTFECPDDPVGKLIYYKKVYGLTYEKFGELMGRDLEQLTDWLSGSVRFCGKNNQEKHRWYFLDDPF